MAIYNTNLSTLTEEQLDTLKYFKYNKETNKLEATRTVSTEPSTVDIGNHSITSGGENVFFTNRTGNIDWFPSWTGIKDQSLLQNQGHTGVIPPTFRHYKTDLLELEVEGQPDISGIVDYNADSIVQINNSVFGQEVIVEENIEPEDFLLYEVRVGTINDPVVYQQILTGISLTAGNMLVWWFDHPVEGRIGTNINSTMKIAKGNQDNEYNFLKVRRSLNNPLNRYIKIKYRLFTDEDVMSGIIYTTESQTIRYAATYAVDTTNGGVNLIVDSNIGYRSFTVFDANQSFNPNSPCVIDFGGAQGTATLQTKNDSFLFYWNGTQWMYLNLDTKDGGIV